MSEHIDYGVRTAKAVTWCRGGRDEAVEHLKHRRAQGYSALLVARTRTDWEETGHDH